MVSAYSLGYVLGYASASTIGGAIYDLARWPGIVIAHFCLQVVVCGVLVVEPCVHQSIADLCRRCHRRCHTEDFEEAEMSSVLPGSESAGPSIRVVAVPPTEQSLPGAVAEDLDQDGPLGHTLHRSALDLKQPWNGPGNLLDGLCFSTLLISVSSLFLL